VIDAKPHRRVDRQAIQLVLRYPTDFRKPGLAVKRLDRLRVRDVQTWLNTLATTCQCCAQGKDARRPARKQRCCAAGACCKSFPLASTLGDARKVLRSALTHAQTEELITRNVAGLAKLPASRKRKGKAWSTEEARRFLESARHDGDPHYATYVLVLVCGLRKGEVLGLTRDDLDLDAAELVIGLQLQRVGRQLLHRETKTQTSDATLPLPGICVTALRHRLVETDDARPAAGSAWLHTGLVFCTAFGTPIDPRNFNRS
jgi:integrase